jgi:hypothetical protein
VGADVEHERLRARRAQPCAQAGRRDGVGVEPVEVDAVAHDVHLVPRDAAADDVVTKALGDRDHGIGGPVGGQLEAFEQAEDARVGDDAELFEDGGPQVAHLHDQPGPPQPGEQPRRAQREEGRRGHHDHVARAGPPAAEQNARNHERQVGQRLADHALVGGGVEPGAHDAVSVDPLGAQPGAAILGWNHAGGMVRHPGEHGDVEAVGRPRPGRLRQPRLRRADLRREVVRHHQDAAAGKGGHGVRPPAVDDL